MRVFVSVLIASLVVGGCTVKRQSLPLSVCTLDSQLVQIDPDEFVAGGSSALGGHSFAEPMTSSAIDSAAASDAATTTATARESRIEEATNQLITAFRINRTKPSTPGEPPKEINQLILSGGGQWGSFGVGFMNKWVRRSGDDRLPVFHSVIGVSTGALQATLALIAHSPLADDRKFEGDYPEGWSTSSKRQFNVDDLVAGYTITRPETLYRNFGEKGAVIKATLGDLEPLEKRMKQLLSKKTLTEVKRVGIEEKRSLKVAVVNWDDGNTYLIDMTKLAAKLKDDMSNFEPVQHCYASVLLAASSETLGMPPVRIGPREGEDGLFFDAGIRFGVLTDEARLAALGAVDRLRGEVANLRSSTYIIANNDLAVSENDAKGRSKWNVLKLMGRGRQILVNQVYLLSVERLMTGADRPDEEVRFAYVRQGDVAACDARRKADKEKFGDSPFYPDFMQCLIERGQARGAVGDWDSR